MIQIKLKDGSTLALESGANALEAAEAISGGLARAAMAAEINGAIRDLRTELKDGDWLNILTFDAEGGKDAFRHTASHILAQAVLRLYPSAKLAIGPAIENGFYYDFDVENPFSQEDLDKIEAEMKKIVNEQLPIERFELPREEAIAMMKKLDQPYKVELIQGLPEGEVISFYRQGDFVDLCAGPHIPDTGRVKALSSSALRAHIGAAIQTTRCCRGSTERHIPKEDLEEHLHRLEEAKKRDHNRIGRELGFRPSTISDRPADHDAEGRKGPADTSALRRGRGREEGIPAHKDPYMAKSDLYKISGHWDHYRKACS